MSTSPRSFADELAELLPADLPNRDACIAGAAHHLELIVETNKKFNLTRILSPREAAIKHVVDSASPWRLFAKAKHVVDAVADTIRHSAGAGSARDALHASDRAQKKAIFLSPRCGR